MKVMYNHNCSICRTEIKQYKRKSSIEFLDCSAMSEKYLRRLHCVTESGEEKVGLDTFIEIWRRSEGLHSLAKLASTPLIYHVGIALYEVAAFLLFYKHKIIQRFSNSDV